MWKTSTRIPNTVQKKSGKVTVRTPLNNVYRFVERHKVGFVASSPSPKDLAKAIFLFFATTGLRRKELFNLKIKDVDFEKRMVIPEKDSSRTKMSWITFYNDEAEKALREYLGSFDILEKSRRLFFSI